MSDQPYDDIRQQFTEADVRFQQALTDAFTNHAKTVALFHTALTRVEQREAATDARLAELQESVEELRRLLLEGR